MNRIGLAIAGVLAVLFVAAIVWDSQQPDTAGPRATATPGADDYQAEYGGSEEVYAEIARETDCAELQAAFDQAAANNDRAEPGTPQHRWTTGYMKAANDRMEAVGCYE